MFEVTKILLASGLLVTIGYLAQTTGLCMVRGVQETLDGKPLFLLSILLSGTLGWVSLLAVDQFGLQNPFTSYQYTHWAILGGGLFGFGAALNNGCGVSTISKLARGQVVMIFTVAGWFIGWQLEELLAVRPSVLVIEVPLTVNLGFLVVITVIVLGCMTLMKAEDRKLWLAMLAIGLIAGLAFLLEPKWTPSGMLKDISLAHWDPPSASWPSALRFFLFFSLVGGMIGAAVWTKSFSYQNVSLKEVSTHLSAGSLMGLGVAFAGGGNDSLLLLGLPSLSVAGVVAVLSIVMGIFIVVQVKKLLR